MIKIYPLNIKSHLLIMKIKFLMPLLFLFAFAQVKAQYAEIRQAIQKQEFSDELINQLKTTKTVFFYSKQQVSQLDSVKQAVSEGWTFTPLIFEDISKFDKYATDPAYSYFIIEGIKSTSSSQTGSYSNIHYYLNLRLFKEINKKGKVSSTGFCRIELFPNAKTLFMGPDDGIGIIPTLYNKGTFLNWSPVLLKAKLAVVSTNLNNRLKPWHYEKVRNDNLSSLLSKDTLYVPKSLLMNFGGFTGKEKEQDENVFASYKYKYKICSDAELFEIFETKKQGKLLFEYVKSSTDKFITIYNVEKKEVIYRNYVPVSYNLKSKDIESIE